MAYTCKRCGYTAKYKWVLRRHLEKMNTCKATINNTSISDLIAELDQDNRYTCDYTESPNVHVCSACNKAYNHTSSLSRHRLTCKEALTEAIESKIMAKVHDMIKLNAQNGHPSHGDQIINNTTNNTNTHNVTNNTNNTNNTQNNINIHINKFGVVDRSFIPKTFLTKCLKQRGNGVVELARATHFSKNHPHNRNVRARNRTALMKYNILDTYTGEKWAPNDSDDVVKKMFDSNYMALDDHLGSNEDELKHELGSALFASIEKWFDQMRNSDPDKTRDIKDALKKLKLLVLEHSS